MRKPIIAGNWKMNNTIKEAEDLVIEIKSNELNEDTEAVLCVPYTSLSKIGELIEGTNIKLGAQNLHWEDSGAYTGEISPLMLKELNVEYVIIGHSERRQYFNETDESVNRKVKKALEHGLKAIVCVGESLEEREANIEKDIIKEQLIQGLKGLSQEDLSNLVIAYEPIWAIGTGKSATSEDANNMCKFIRDTINELFLGSENVVRIQYGGSVKPGNVVELMNMSDIDGALVGGASLKSDDFVKLVNFNGGSHE